MSDAKNIYDKLRAVQIELKVPKSQRNNFGNYNYRNAEDILEAVKPVLDRNGLTLIVSDKLVNIGERYYVEATAVVSDGVDGDGLFSTGYAREEETKKGMDGSQITGAASSYARKYALNGLFAIDDTKDADSHDNSQSGATQPARKLSAASTGLATDYDKSVVTRMYRVIGASDENIRSELKNKYGIDAEHPMSKVQFNQIVEDLK